MIESAPKSSSSRPEDSWEPDVLPEVGSIRAAVNKDLQTVAKSGMLIFCLESMAVGPEDDVSSESVVTSIMADAFMEIEPCTENARWIGSVLRLPMEGTDDLIEPETD